jgi:hypothetical protein
MFPTLHQILINLKLMDLVNSHNAITILDGASDMYPGTIGQLGFKGLKFSSCICADIQGTHVLIPQMRPVKAQHLHHHFHPATSLAKAKAVHQLVQL